LPVEGRVAKLFGVVASIVLRRCRSLGCALFAVAIAGLNCDLGVDQPDPSAEDPLAADIDDFDASDAACTQPPPATDAPAAIDSPNAETCPTEMVLVDGDYCPVVRRDCLRWLDDPDVFSYARCAAYDPIPICLAARQHKRFCIDRDEYTGPDEQLPSAHRSWTQARQICQEQGKRLCQESEWEFACEGEGMMPYPYGLVRDASLCNFDQMDLYLPDGSLRDMREPSSARPQCESPFGVRNMVGNLDEWTVRETTPGPHRSALRGGWWMAARSRCRAATTAHGEIYEGPQTGVRCCSEPTMIDP
jgi:formylglycine-generating enzyme